MIAAMSDRTVSTLRARLLVELASLADILVDWDWTQREAHNLAESARGRCAHAYGLGA